METPFEKIIQLLDSRGIIYELVEHEMVFTSEEAAKVRGFSLKQGAKSLILKHGNEFVMAVLPGDRKLDTKKLKKILEVRDLRFASPEEVKNLTGVEIGAVYPFGSIAKMKAFVDMSLGENEYIGFNPGVHDKSIKMRFVDYKEIVSVEFVDITHSIS